MAVCREVIEQLETTQEDRQLSPGENQLLKLLRHRLLGLAAIEKSRVRQKYRLTWIRKGDANTRFFQIMANVSKQKNYIHSLHLDNNLAATQQDKHQAIYDHFRKHIGSYEPRSCS
jgi:hypothetical protein